MAAKKKIEIVLDVDGKPIDVVIDKTLNLQQQAKALTAELRRTSDPEAFKILSNRLGDVNDGLAITNAKSKDLFTSLSMLPGPVGDFFSQLSGSVDLLKTFSSFSLKDLSFQLGETAADIADIGKNLVSTTAAQVENAAATEAQVVAVEELAVAEATATVSTEAHVAATEAEVVATEAAEVATIGLGTALKAIGIGLLIAGIAALVAYWDKLVDAITGATDVTRAYDDAQKQVTKDVSDFNVKLFEVNASIDAAKKGTMSKTDALKDYNDKLGKTIGYAGSLEQAEALMASNTSTVIESIKLRAQAQIFYAKSAEASAKMISGEGLEPDFWDQALNYIKTGGNFALLGSANIETYSENIAKNLKTSKDFAAEGDKLINQAIENDLKLKKGLAKPPEVKGAETKTKTVKDDNQRLLDLAKKYEADLISIQTKGDRERQVQDIKNAADAEKREVGKLEGITKENEKVRSKLLIDIETAAEGKLTKLREGWADEDLKQRETYLKKISDLQIKANEDNYALQTEALNKQLVLDIAAWNKEVEEFNKKNEKIQISEEQQKAYIIALRKSTQDQIQKITDEGIIKSIQKNAQVGNFTLQNVLDVATQFQGDLINQISNLPKDFFGVFFGSTKKQMQNLFAETTRMEVYYYDERGKRIEKVLDSEIKFAEEAYRKKEKQIKKEVADAEERNQIVTINRKTGVKSEWLSDEKLAEFKILKQKELLDAYIEYANKKMAYDKLMQDSEYAVTDAVVQNFEKTSALINALSQIKDAQWTADAQRFDDQLALYEEDSDEYKKILKEKRAAEEEYLKQVKKMQIAAALVDAGVSIARVIIDTQRAIIAFSASVAPLGPAGVPLAAAYAIQSKIGAALAIATITASGIAKIKNINSQQASTDTGDSAGGTNMGRGYAEGGYIEGPRHAGGGVMINAEGGEAVMTRGAVTMFGPMLSAMNQMGGGTSFTKGAVGMARPDNPEVKNVPLQNSTQIIKTYVVESELTSAQQRQARLKDLSTL